MKRLPGIKIYIGVHIYMCVYQKCKSKIPKSDHIKVWTQKRLQGIHTPVTNCWRTNSIVIPSTFPPEDLLWAGFKGVLSLLSLLFVFSSDHWDKKNKQTPTHCPISVDEPLILWDWRLRFHSPFKSLALLWAWLQVLSKPYITPLPGSPCECVCFHQTKGQEK